MSERTYIYRMTNGLTIQNFERMAQLSIYLGLTVPATINVLIQEFLDKEDFGILLGNETELLEYLLANKAPTNKGTLRFLRERKRLVWKEKDLCFSNGQNVIYDLKGCLELFLFRKRKKTKSDQLEKVA